MRIDPDAPGLLAILRGERGPVWRWLVTAALVLITSLAVNATIAVLAGPAKADALEGSMNFGGTPRIWVPPSPVTWSRQDPAGLPPYNPFGILALTSDSNQVNSFAWPLYITLNATTNPAASQATSQSTGAQVRMYNSSSGSPWAAAFHAEIRHGQVYGGAAGDGANAAASGTSLGYSAELTRLSPHGFTAAFNANNGSPQGFPGDVAYNVQGAWKVGLDAGGTDVRAKRFVLGPGVYITYNAGTGRVEVWRTGHRVRSF